MVSPDDEVLICPVCGQPKETIKKWFDGNYRKLATICDCDRAEAERTAKRFRQEEIVRKKALCFNNKMLFKSTFENDDGKNENVRNFMLNYTKHFEEFLDSGSGILMYGNSGTGKSFYAACIANRLIEKGYTCLMSNFIGMISEMNKTFDSKIEYIQAIKRYDLLIIDDLGVERQSDYMQEQVYHIINERYISGKPMIITTNLTYQEIALTEDIKKKRIYDRILEKCARVKLESVSRRKEQGIKNNTQMRDRLR